MHTFLATNNNMPELYTQLDFMIGAAGREKKKIFLQWIQK